MVEFEHSEIDDFLDDYENQKKQQGRILKKEEVKAKKWKPKSALNRIRFLPMVNGDNVLCDIAWFYQPRLKGYLDTYRTDMIYSVAENAPKDQKEEERLKDAMYVKFKSLDDEWKTASKSRREQIQEEIRYFRPVKYYIFNILDRNNPDAGVKFFYMRDSYDKTGVFDKLIPLFKKYKQKNNGIYPTDLENGCDFEIHANQKTLPTNKDVKYWEVTSFMFDNENSPAFDREDQKKLFQKDLEEITWRNAWQPFAINGNGGLNKYEFLESVANYNPVMWVDKGGVKGWYYADGTQVVIEKNTTNSDDNSQENNKNNTNLNESLDVDNDSPLDSLDDDLPF